VLDKNHHPQYFQHHAENHSAEKHKAQTDFWATTHSNASKRPFKQSFQHRSSQRARTHLQQRIGRFKRSASVRVRFATHRRKYNEIREYINYLDNALTC
jgi:hypothetical protein